MNGGTAGGLPPETRLTITGPITWAGGYVIRCAGCGAAGGWILAVRPGGGPVDRPGDDADLTCLTCERVQRNPLVYPDMVWAIWSSRRGGTFTGQEAAAALEAIDWRPHTRVVRHGAVRYLPWEHEPGPDEAAWPDLAWAWEGGTLPRPPSTPR